MKSQCEKKINFWTAGMHRHLKITFSSDVKRSILVIKTILMRLVIWLDEFEELDETNGAWSKCHLKLQADDPVM